ncbi:MAG: hypothetical protein D6702_04215 [Planctomycetota bacterium]|nr:MAG: hypothetical protein D6702_04215 [Planctomycetota bacterium]
MFGAALLLLAAQDPAPAAEPTAAEPLPPGIVARWNDGEITAEDFERFLGRSFHRKPLGQEALRHLLQIQLVEREAAAAGLRIDDAEVADRLSEIRRQAEAEGFDLDSALRSRGLDPEEFRRLLRDSLLHEELVRRDLGLGPDQTPTPEQQEKWTNDRIEELLAASAAAPVGYALDEPPFRITLLELGAAIRAALPPSRQREYLEQLVLQRHLAAWARKEGVVLRDEILEQEIEWRRRHVAESPAYGGMSYDQILASQGSSLAGVRGSDELRTAGYLRLLARRRWPDSWFESLSPEERRTLEGQAGEARLVRWILLRAKEEKTDPLDLDFAEARQELADLAAEATDEAAFARLAGEVSEDDASRRRGGLLGWVHRLDPAGADPAVVEAAFALEPGRVSEPIRVAGGMALVWLSEIRPRPEEAEFREEVRRSRHQQLRREILDSIGLRTG